ncbi:nadp-specific glutamate dehydrogenase 1-related [Anaeramoeba flamelloides]|uniref:Glutamate dehydrogenase n=1 Tax=Anaeramoeba flamelloides TaxID=1746091 RepID=A0AAV7YH88_9EUKA|nr:nadp-specific glutamate dehydrogenase 1-related [Anaeramoeba flamelloides]
MQNSSSSQFCLIIILFVFIVTQETTETYSMNTKDVSNTADEILLKTNNDIGYLLGIIKKRDPHQDEFYQAVEEIIRSLEPVFAKDKKYIKVMEQILEPERIIQFRVAWVDDKGNKQINRGFRVQFNSAIGPYKGGLRFHPSVDLSIIKFLGFEQIFKNALTTLPMGGGKGGSDFDPKGKSDNEVMRFCQSFMIELSRHIGMNVDIPAGDIGVGGREIGYLYGMYKKLSSKFEGVLTGKGRNWGGSFIRPEATGYGLIYFTNNMLQANGKSIKGKRVLISGAGNVAIYCVEKLLMEGAIPLTMSDSKGTLYVESGIDKELFQEVVELKNVQRGRLSQLEGRVGVKYFEGKKPWNIPADIALPCAFQNEINEEDARNLINNGVWAIAEGANMPSTPKAQQIFLNNNVLYGPAKAANAGGVAVSGLEISQNALRLNWSREEVDQKLQAIMKKVFEACEKAAKEYGKDGNYMAGANIAGFLKVANSMIEQGWI